MSDLTNVDREMASVINTRKKPSIVKQIEIPKLVFNDLSIGALLPGGEDSHWEITVDGESNIYRSYLDERFVLLDSDFPREVKIQETRSSVLWSYRLWEDEKNNRLLIFSRLTGAFVKSASLADSEVWLDPGEFSFLLRFEPDDGDIEVISEYPDIFLKEVDLGPGEQLLIQRGPASVPIKVNDVPSLNCSGTFIQGMRGTTIYQSENFYIDVSIPRELILSDDDLFVLRLHSSVLGDDIEIPLIEIGNGKISVDMKDCFSKWQPGCSRILITLSRTGSKRSLARKSIIIWNGLNCVNNSVEFYCDVLPGNLEEDGCQNIKIKNNEALTYKDEFNKTFKFAFQDGRRKIYFTGAVPGIFIGEIDYKNGRQVERSLSVGSHVTVTNRSVKMLKLYATYPVTLKLGALSVG